jgi:hypothetical protein
MRWARARTTTKKRKGEKMKTIKKYKSIRSADQRSRCKNGGRALYCGCGCMTPVAGDPDLDVAGVALAKKADGDFNLIRDGALIGSYDPQYEYLAGVDGVEFLGCDPALVAHLLAMVRAGNFTLPEEKIKPKPVQKTDNVTAVVSPICRYCGTYCYGDCGMSGQDEELAELGIFRAEMAMDNNNG